MVVIVGRYGRGRSRSSRPAVLANGSACCPAFKHLFNSSQPRQREHGPPTEGDTQTFRLVRRCSAAVSFCSGQYGREVGAMRSDDALATILLVSRIASDGTRPLTARQFWKLVDQVGHPGGLLGMTEDDLVASGLAPDMASRVACLLARATAMAFRLDELDQSGITTLTPFDDFYPQRFRTSLGTKAPAILHAAGALELLDEGGVGVVGSRNVSNEGARVAVALGKQAASLRVPLISGEARGVDQLAMNAAFTAGGNVIAVPAHALSRTLKSRDLRRAIYDDRTVICTPYAPNSPFSVGRALGRNKLIYGLSDVTVAVAADKGSGGTWSGATEAMKGRYCRVAVWRALGEGPGNEALADMGATPITDVSQLRDILDSPRSENEESSSAEQAALF